MSEISDYGTLFYVFFWLWQYFVTKLLNYSELCEVTALVFCFIDICDVWKWLKKNYHWLQFFTEL